MNMRTIRVRTSNGEEFIVDKDVLSMSTTVTNFLEDGLDDDDENGFIPLPNVSGKMMPMIIEYCKFHHNYEKVKSEHAIGNKDEILHTEADVKAWDDNFVKVDQSTLFDLILAANYLNIKELLDLCCQTVANMIKGKSPEEIRKTFNIANDFTPEEEEEVRRENQWVFD